MSVSIPGRADTTNPAPASCARGRAGHTASCLPSGSDGGHHGVVSGVRDYLAWHEQYEDPGSSLSRRLALVREVLQAELDTRPGPVRVVSLCAGDGRDILGVLAEREDAARVSVTLVEVLPELVERARSAAAEVAADVEVVAADAGCSETYVRLGTVPADVVLLVGVLGNISDADVAATVAAMPGLCASGHAVVEPRAQHRGLRRLRHAGPWRRPGHRTSSKSSTRLPSGSATRTCLPPGPLTTSLESGTPAARSRSTSPARSSTSRWRRLRPGPWATSGTVSGSVRRLGVRGLAEGDHLRGWYDVHPWPVAVVGSEAFIVGFPRWVSGSVAACDLRSPVRVAVVKFGLRDEPFAGPVRSHDDDVGRV